MQSFRRARWTGSWTSSASLDRNGSAAGANSWEGCSWMRRLAASSIRPTCDAAFSRKERAWASFFWQPITIAPAAFPLQRRGADIQRPSAFPCRFMRPGGVKKDGRLHILNEIDQLNHGAGQSTQHQAASLLAGICRPGPHSPGPTSRLPGRRPAPCPYRLLAQSSWP